MYKPLDLLSVVLYINSKIAELEIFKNDLDNSLTAVDIADGNLNMVFQVFDTFSPSKSVIVKQGLPYVRRAGEGWPLTPERAVIEGKAMKNYLKICPKNMPKLYFTDNDMYLNVMEDLKPRIILRNGLIEKKHLS